MSSLIRRWQRKRLRDAKTYVGPKPRFEMHPDNAGYDAWHPTKGRRRFSAARLRAQFRMARILDRGA